MRTGCCVEGYYSFVLLWFYIRRKFNTGLATKGMEVPPFGNVKAVTQAYFLAFSYFFISVSIIGWLRKVILLLFPSSR